MTMSELLMIGEAIGVVAVFIIIAIIVIVLFSLATATKKRKTIARNIFISLIWCFALYIGRGRMIKDFPEYLLGFWVFAIFTFVLIQFMMWAIAWEKTK